MLLLAVYQASSCFANARTVDRFSRSEAMSLAQARQAYDATLRLSSVSMLAF
jgi:hypothetical protein